MNSTLEAIAKEEEAWSLPDTEMGDPSRASRLAGWWRRPLRPGWLHLMGLTVLLVGTCLVYAPSLAHGPRADHWCFLLDTIDHDEFWSLWKHTYSYNRTREIWRGDYGLFRPVLFGLLSAEKALFGHHFVAWQMTGIVLHLATVGVFLAILLRVAWLTDRPDMQPLAYALAGFFAWSYACAEMVSWSHINGYILFLLLVLAAVGLLIDVIAGGELSLRWRWARFLGAYVLLVVAAFTYEIGSLFAVITGGLVATACWRAGQRREGILVLMGFSSILVLFLVLNGMDQLAHPRRTESDDLAGIRASLWVAPTGWNVVRYLLYTVVQPFFPSCLEWEIWMRLIYHEPVRHLHRYVEGSLFLAFSYLISGLLLLGSLVSLVVSLYKRDSVRLLLVGFPGGLLSLHLAITVLGRLNLRPESLDLATSTYYAYLPLLCVLLMTFVFWTGLGWPFRGRGQFVLVVGLWVLAGTSGIMTRHILYEMRREVKPIRVQTEALRRVIRQHGHEPGFGLSFTPEALRRCVRFHQIPAPYILFRRYINPGNPSHLATFHRGSFRVYPVAEYMRRFGPLREPIPVLHQVGPVYNIFWLEDRYYGIHSGDESFLDGRPNHFYAAEGQSVQEVLRKIPEKLREAEEDIVQGRIFHEHQKSHELEKCYRGFALYRVDQWYFAIPTHERPLEAGRFQLGRYSCWFRGGSFEEVKGQIDEVGPSFPSNLP